MSPVGFGVTSEGGDSAEDDSWAFAERVEIGASPDISVDGGNDAGPFLFQNTSRWASRFTPVDSDVAGGLTMGAEVDGVLASTIAASITAESDEGASGTGFIAGSKPLLPKFSSCSSGSPNEDW